MCYDENISFFYRRVFNTFTLLDFVGLLKTLKYTENAKFLTMCGLKVVNSQYNIFYLM